MVLEGGQACCTSTSTSTRTSTRAALVLVLVLATVSHIDAYPFHSYQVTSPLSLLCAAVGRWLQRKAWEGITGAGRWRQRPGGTRPVGRPRRTMECWALLALYARTSMSSLRLGAPIYSSDPSNGCREGLAEAWGEASRPGASTMAWVSHCGPRLRSCAQSRWRRALCREMFGQFGPDIEAQPKTFATTQ